MAPRAIIDANGNASRCFMIGNVLAGVRTPQWTALCLGLFTCITASMASAADCPGHPDALGTSRTLVVDPKAHPRIGRMQYAETLPLRDHEVVLTFDDGPLPHNSNQVLEILASQCVKATFFTVGRMAQSSPEGVRKLREAGHSIGTHTQNHPLGFDKFSAGRARQEIDDGIASVTAALGADGGLAPFFRPPGLRSSPAVEDHLASLGIQIWSADFPADDWRHIPPSRVYDLAMKRLEAKGKGILLLHDIQARTVAALPRILHEMKARGYRIVHVVPATSQEPKTPTEPPQWQSHPPSETVAISHWPKIPNFVFADAGTLPAPALPDTGWHDEKLIPLAEPFDRSKRRARGVPLPRQALWPRQSPLPPDAAAIVLPVPAQSIFEIQEKRAATQTVAPTSQHAEQAVPAEHEAGGTAGLIPVGAGDSRRKIPGTPYLGRARQPAASQTAARGIRLAARAGRGMPKR
jgi:peptidoglycan/xylan/chitin deacetylase (PgdA/CDA1 family)